MMQLASSDLDRAICWLLIGAIFFAMRSCEYLKTSEENSKRTKIIRLKNIAFKKQGKVVDHFSKTLHDSDLVMITFEFQKNTQRNQSVHMFRSKDNLLNPVLAWATTVSRILKTIPDASQDTKVCAFKSGSNIINIDGDIVRSKLRSIVHIIGEEKLGFSQHDIGMASIRSGGAMAMFLSGVNEIVIKRVGRWKSDAFLEYIREQVDSFTLGVSQKMLQFENFHHLNDKESDKFDTEEENKNGDGPIQIPFSVHYSEAVMNEYHSV